MRRAGGARSPRRQNPIGGQKKPRQSTGLRYERGSSKRELPLARRGSVLPYSSMVRISPSTSPRRLVKRAAAAPLITR